MSKLERWLTLVANLSVVAGIVFLAAQMRQNTQAIQSQTRDAITEKQITLSELLAQPEWVEIYERAQDDRDALTRYEGRIFSLMMSAIFREWENSFFQYDRGLFTEGDFDARRERWERELRRPASRRAWTAQRETFSQTFRSEVDRIVAEVEQAQ